MLTASRQNFFWIKDFIEIKKKENTPHTNKTHYLHRIKERKT